MYKIYRATNKRNGKFYLGVTKKELNARIRGHWHVATCLRRQQTVFAKALRKWGLEAFDFEVIARLDTFEEAMSEERRLIALHKPPYNVSVGGRGPNIVNWSKASRTARISGLKQSWTEERKKRHSAIMTGRTKTAEQIEKIKASWRPAKGWAKPVVCLNDGMFFKSTTDAASHYGITRANVRSVTSGLQTMTKGMSFVLATEPLSDSERARLLDLATARRTRHRDWLGISRRRAVVRLNDGKIFESIEAAGIANGISGAAVAQKCREGTTTKAGLRFAYVGKRVAPQKVAA